MKWESKADNKKNEDILCKTIKHKKKEEVDH